LPPLTIGGAWSISIGSVQTYGRGWWMRAGRTFEPDESAASIIFQ
jgi:hypothetical protein